MLEKYILISTQKLAILLKEFSDASIGSSPGLANGVVKPQKDAVTWFERALRKYGSDSQIVTQRYICFSYCLKLGFRHQNQVVVKPNGDGSSPGLVNGVVKPQKDAVTWF